MWISPELSWTMGSIDLDLQASRSCSSNVYLRNGLIDWHLTKNVMIDGLQRRTCIEQCINEDHWNGNWTVWLWKSVINSDTCIRFTCNTECWWPRGNYTGYHCSCFTLDLFLSQQNTCSEVIITSSGRTVKRTISHDDELVDCSYEVRKCRTEFCDITLQHVVI